MWQLMSSTYWRNNTIDIRFWSLICVRERQVQKLWWCNLQNSCLPTASTKRECQASYKLHLIYLNHGLVKETHNCVQLKACITGFKLWNIIIKYKHTLSSFRSWKMPNKNKSKVSKQFWCSSVISLMILCLNNQQFSVWFKFGNS